MHNIQWLNWDDLSISHLIEGKLLDIHFCFYLVQFWKGMQRFPSGNIFGSSFWSVPIDMDL